MLVNTTTLSAPRSSLASITLLFFRELFTFITVLCTSLFLLNVNTFSSSITLLSSGVIYLYFFFQQQRYIISILLRIVCNMFRIILNVKILVKSIFLGTMQNKNTQGNRINNSKCAGQSSTNLQWMSESHPKIEIQKELKPSLFDVLITPLLP